MHDEAVAEDFVIESMMYYWENKDRLPDTINIPAYVLTTIKHKCIDHPKWASQQPDRQGRSWNLPNLALGSRPVNRYIGGLCYEVLAEIQEIVDKTLIACPNKLVYFRMSRYENKSHKEIAAL